MLHHKRKFHLEFVAVSLLLSAQCIAAPENTTTDDPISLSTLDGFELGGEVSHYRYQEEVHGANYMHETGVKFGIIADAAQRFGDSFFVKGDARLAYSNNSYKSPHSGTQNGIADYLGEVRVLLGKDFLLSDVDLSPYAGLGYRNLYNDLRGVASSGSRGYRRDSNYFYAPIGITPRLRINDAMRITTDMEYDQLIYGIQNTDLQDFNPGYPNISNGQPHGYGLRGDIMVETTSWSVGPFIQYWNIDRSESTPFAAYSTLRHGDEPKNQTIEFGLQGRYRF